MCGYDIYEDLSVRARNGDALAARELGQQLRICEEAHRDEKSLKLEIEAINNAFETGNEEKYSFEPRDDYQRVLSFIAQLESDYNRCKSISEVKLREKTEFFEIASGLGDYMATAILSNEYGYNDDWVNLHSVSEKLWLQHGSPSALFDLARIYSENHIVPSKNTLNGQPVRVLVHAYNTEATEYAYSSLYTAYPHEAATFSPRYETEAFLTRTAQHLSPDEQLTAEQLALELLQDNKNCCLRLF